jgi:hypothetical protein
MEGDRGAFMATIAPGASDFRRRQAKFWDGLQSIPLTTYRLEVEPETYGDLATDADRAAYETADRVTLPHTVEHYRLRGFDNDAAVEDMYYTYVEVDGRWYIASDTDAEDIAFYSARHPWDYGQQIVRRAEDFLLLSTDCERCATFPPRASVLARTAIDRVDRYWGGSWRHRVVVVVPPGADELTRMLQATFDVDDFVAFAYSTVDLEQGIDYTGHRVILNPNAFVGRSATSSLDILAHELLHIATRPLSGPFIPSFIEEGIAEYVGKDADPADLAFFDYEAATGSFDGKLPEEYQFRTGEGSDIFRSYQKSYSALRFFIDRWGSQAFLRLYRRLGRVEVAPGTARFHLDRALRSVVGVGVAKFERLWAGSIETP